jgi:hypothetical protein
MSTLEDLTRARAELQWCIDNFDDALMMYRAQLAAHIRTAYMKVCDLEEELNKHGLIADHVTTPRSEEVEPVASSPFH